MKMHKLHKPLNICYNIIINKVITLLDTRLRSIGNSQGIIIRSPILKLLNLEKGDKLEIVLEKKKIILSKVVEINDKDKKGK